MGQNSSSQVTKYLMYKKTNHLRKLLKLNLNKIFKRKKKKTLILLSRQILCVVNEKKYKNFKIYFFRGFYIFIRFKDL